MMESFRDELSGIELSEASGLMLPRDRVVVKMETPRFSEILVTPTEPHSRIGTVVKLGKRPLTSKGVELEHVIQEGDRVAVSPHNGVSVLWQGCPALILREMEVLAVIERSEVETTRWCDNCQEQTELVHPDVTGDAGWRPFARPDKTAFCVRCHEIHGDYIWR